MLINVSSLAPNTSIPVSFKAQELTIPRSGGDVKALVDVEGTLDLDTRERYTLNARVSAVLSLNCDLCLKSFKSEIDFTVKEVFCNEINPDEEFWDFSDKTIDLKPAVVADILLNLPMRAVCSDDCKGLCPVCGHNLNEGECSCDRTKRNPQFEKLLTLFKDDKEV